MDNKILLDFDEKTVDADYEIIDEGKVNSTFQLIRKRIEYAYKLYKEGMQPEMKDISIVYAPPVLSQEISDIEINKQINSEFRQIIDKFLDTITQNFDGQLLANMKENLKTLTVEYPEQQDLKTRFFLKRATTLGGFYDNKKNNVVYLRGDEKTMFHELFHMASTKQSKDKEYVGFAQKDIGVALTEGYTEALTERYFFDSNSQNVYVTETRTAKIIEKIVGKEKMEELFLTANLPGLIDELSKYSSEEETMKFLSRLDYEHNIYYKRNSIFLRMDGNKLRDQEIENRNAFNDLNLKYLFDIYKEKIEKSSAFFQENASNISYEKGIKINNYISESLSKEKETYVGKEFEKEVTRLMMNQLYDFRPYKSTMFASSILDINNSLRLRTLGKVTYPTTDAFFIIDNKEDVVRHNKTMDNFNDEEKKINNDFINNYITGGYQGVLNDLEKYTSHEELEDFLLNVDKVSKCFNIHPLDESINNVKDVDQTVVNIEKFLINYQTNKTLNKLEKGEIDLEEVNNKFGKMCEEYSSPLHIESKHDAIGVGIINVDEIKNMIANCAANSQYKTEINESLNNNQSVISL